jgi:hypothetical protein
MCVNMGEKETLRDRPKIMNLKNSKSIQLTL